MEHRTSWLRLCPTAIAVGAVTFAMGQTNVLTQRNDNYRTGANLNERTLTTANVGSTNFGKICSFDVDGQVYAQPLVARVNMGPKLGIRNVLFVATAHNSVYAFNADATDDRRISWNRSTRPLWRVNLGPSVPNSDVGSNDMSPEIGIVSTPVVDLELGTIFVVAKTRESGRYINRLHALDITTGRPRPGSPAVIAGSVPGTGDGSTGGSVPFQSYYQMNRPGLLALNGRIYIAFGSHGDMRPYNGWVFSYDMATLRRVAIHACAPDGIMSGIWQSGTGLSANDDGEIFYMSGNGTFSETGNRNMGNSFVKLRVASSGQMSVDDWFTPYDSEFMNWYDLDLGSSGPILIPGTRLLLGGGKYGGLYLLNQRSMGKFNSTRNDIVQNVPAMAGHLHFGPVIYRRESDYLVYLWSEEDRLKQYTLRDGMLSETPTSMSDMSLPWGMPGGMLALSANGTNPGTAIVWAATPTDNANQQTVPGEFRAFDALDLTRVLWSSTNRPGDAVGNFAKFCPPTVANGRVYLATFSNKVHVYGLRPGPL